MSKIERKKENKTKTQNLGNLQIQQIGLLKRVNLSSQSTRLVMAGLLLLIPIVYLLYFTFIVNEINIIGLLGIVISVIVSAVIVLIFRDSSKWE